MKRYESAQTRTWMFRNQNKEEQRNEKILSFATKEEKTSSTTTRDNVCFCKQVNNEINNHIQECIYKSLLR